MGLGKCHPRIGSRERAKLTSKTSVIMLGAGNAPSVVLKYVSGSCDDILKINAFFELNLWGRFADASSLLF